MDPNYQVDETFAKTVTGIEELRKKYRRDDEMDWREWRRTLVSAAQAGAKLERDFNSLRMEVAKAARSETVAGLIQRIEFLEYVNKTRFGISTWVWGVVSGIIVGVAIVIAGKHI